MSKIIKHEMKFSVVMMTPEWAQELLNKNHPRNRNRKEKKISGFMRDMEQGYWELTPEPIALDVEDHLINGQNRLSAVVRSGIEVPMTLVTGCPVRSIRGMDQGAVRTVGDIATISGENLICNANSCAGIIRRMYAGLTAKQMTNAEVIAFGKYHHDAISFAFKCLPKSIKGITHAPVRAVIARAYYKKTHRARTESFCEYLISGLPEKPQADSGAIRLRNWLQDTFLGGINRRGIKRAPAVIVYAKTERALEAFHNQEFIQSLQEKKKELFPLPNEK